MKWRKARELDKQKAGTVERARLLPNPPISRTTPPRNTNGGSAFCKVLPPFVNDS
ncbi:MAG: hypothetical protein RSD76_01780 [Clostridia bacterium]